MFWKKKKNIQMMLPLVSSCQLTAQKADGEKYSRLLYLPSSKCLRKHLCLKRLVWSFDFLGSIAVWLEITEEAPTIYWEAWDWAEGQMMKLRLSLCQVLLVLQIVLLFPNILTCLSKFSSSLMNATTSYLCLLPWTMAPPPPGTLLVLPPA